MILHLPPHRPSDPSRQNTSTYLQERRDKKINDYTLNYITTYQASAPFVSSGGDRAQLCVFTMYVAACRDLHRRWKDWLNKLLYYKNQAQNKRFCTIEQDWFRLRMSPCPFQLLDLENVHLSSSDTKTLLPSYKKRQWKAHIALGVFFQSRCHINSCGWVMSIQISRKRRIHPISYHVTFYTYCPCTHPHTSVTMRQSIPEQMCFLEGISVLILIKQIMFCQTESVHIKNNSSVSATRCIPGAFHVKATIHKRFLQHHIHGMCWILTIPGRQQSQW